jgi:spermidine/putrescine-binding protein
MIDLTPRELTGALRDRRIDRRQALRLLAAAGVATYALPLYGRPAAAAPNLIYYTWSGYDNPDFQQAYVAAFGGPPEYAIFADEEEALQRMRAGFRADVAHPCTSNVVRWHDAGILKPIDVSRLKHWEEIYPSFKKVHGVEIDGQIFHVPWEWGNTSVAYRPDLVEIEEESYSILLDDRYKGKLSVFDNSEEVPVIAALIAGIKNPFDMTDDDLVQVREIMKRMNENMRFYWADATQMQQALASGELVATTSWNDTVKSMADQGVPVKFMNPKEGILTWVCGMALLKDGPGDEEQAYAFIDAMLAPETGALLMETYYYGHSNRETLKVADPQLVKDLGLDQAEARIADPNTHFFEPMPNELREKLSALLEEVKSGL